MRKRELPPEQKEYRRFDRRRGVIIKTLIVFLVAILVCFFAAFWSVEENPTPLLLFLGILILYAIVTVYICLNLTRKHGQLYVAAYGNDADIIRNGLFGELWNEFEWNQYEGLTDGKVVFAETHNNTIDLQIIRHKHEFSVEITSDGLYLICDEETDAPIEKELPLSGFENVGDIFTAIRTFVESNS